MHAIEIRELTKTFAFRDGRRALAGINLQIRPGEMVALIGASGSGKSTLLRQVAGLITGDRATAGEVRVFGRAVQSCGVLARDARAIRAQMSFVAQQFNLVDRLPVLTNVLIGLLPRMPAWRTLTMLFTHEELAAARDALARVGIAECAEQRASTLSGGQQQRAAIARAIVQRASIILADEPIASLDPESSRRVMELLALLNREAGVTVLVSLHQVNYATRYCKRAVALRRGEIVFDGASAELSQERLRALYGDGSLVVDGERAVALPLAA